MAASDSAHDNSAPRAPYAQAPKNHQRAQSNAPYQPNTPYRPNTPRHVQQSVLQSDQHAPQQGQSDLWGKRDPWADSDKQATPHALLGGPLGPGLSTFGMGKVLPQPKPQDKTYHAPAATAAQEEYLQRGRKQHHKIASAEDLAEEFSQELAQEQSLHSWPTDPAARTKVSIDELIANSSALVQAHKSDPVSANKDPIGISAAALEAQRQMAQIMDMNRPIAQQVKADQEGAFYDPSAVIAAEPIAHEVVALTPQEQLEQSIAARDAALDGPEILAKSATNVADALQGGLIAAGDSGNKEQDERAGFEQAAKLRRDDRRRTQKAISALDVLLKQIEARSGIKVDEVEVDPFEYYVIRKNEIKEVAAQVAKRQEEYFRNFIDKLRSDGQINPNYTFATIDCDELNRHAITLGQNFVRSVIEKPSRKLFLLFGDMGTGKTVIVHALANMFMDLRAADPKFFAQRTNTQMPLVMVVTLEDLKKAWLFPNDETNEQRSARELKLKQYYEVDLLVLDGLCCDFVALTPFNQRSLNALLRYRAEHNLPMIVSTPIRFQALHQAVGDTVFEGLKSFEVTATALLGASRRSPMSLNGTPIP